MKTRIMKTIIYSFCIFMFCIILCSCKTFEEWFVTTKDGFTYYYNENNGSGPYIIEIPNNEELVIPEFIDGKRVKKLGFMDMGIGYLNEYRIMGENTKDLTIQHQFDVCDYNDDTVNFPNLTKLTFMDFLYCNLSYSEDELIVPHYIGKKSSNVPNVELKKTDREFDLSEFQAKVILIPDYVNIIDEGIFDGLNGVTIKTSYANKPAGWADGWNGDCEVEWNVDINYLTYRDYLRETEDGLTYYYNPSKEDGVTIVHIGRAVKEVVIPEYINGNKVIRMGYSEDGFKSEVHGTNVTKLTIQHSFEIQKDNESDEGYVYVYFYNLTNLIFMDYLYCNKDSITNEIVVPWYIGEKDYDTNIPVVELRKSNRSYSLENFMSKVIIIPEYVKIIEKGVFDGLDGVTIKTSYENKPEGWDDGWNSNCEVEWGYSI